MNELTESVLFRQKLYQNFKDSGLLSKLKTTLRANLLQKLQKPLAVPQPQSSQDKSLPFHLKRKFLESIIAQHLRMMNKEYSLSIFQAECDLEDEDCLRYNQLSEITNLQLLANGKSYLFRLVEEFGKIRCQQARERGCQTDFQEPLSKKLDIIDSSYRAKIDYWKLIPPTKITKTNTTDSLFQQQQKLRAQFNVQKERMKRELQLSLKQQIEKKFENQYSFRMHQVQKQHEGRLNEIKTRQREILTGLEKKRRQLEEKGKSLSEQEQKMINRYQLKFKELETQYRAKMKELENKEKQFWKKELELKAKKRQYEETIRLVKQKVIAQVSQ